GIGNDAENICGTTGVLDSDESQLPFGFNLEQNYPNPFNPSTTIKFAIPESGVYSLKIYNSLGEEVVELFNKKLETGFYDIDFDASQLSSGMYIYNIKGSNINLSKKMMLLR